MDFIDEIKNYAKRVESLKDGLQTEEATKTSLIMPFFSLLGYDVFNPQEFIPEYTADVGIKKGEKVDYAILSNGEPTILVECKWIGEKLDKHGSQLFRYFSATPAKFGILTNGRFFRFFTDLDKDNVMDAKPFLEVDILNIKDTQIAELKKFHKSNFDIDTIFGTASELRYTAEFKAILAAQLQDPSDDFVKFFLTQTYDGKQTSKVIDKFRPILKRSLNMYISELMNEKIQSALSVQEESPTEPADETVAVPDVEPKLEKENKIVTTEEELEAYFIIKNMLKDMIPFKDVLYKDNLRYMAILYKGITTRWICRLYFNSSKKYITIPDDNKKEVVLPIVDVYEIEKYETEIKKSANRYIK